MTLDIQVEITGRVMYLDDLLAEVYRAAEYLLVTPEVSRGRVVEQNL